jgi:hypothetical protein
MCSKTMVLLNVMLIPLCLQLAYTDGPTIMHGTDMGDNSLTAGAIQLDDCEQLSGIFGTSGSLVYSIGFNTSLGHVYGPWGSTQGQVFAYSGAIYGFFGGDKWGSIGALGAWVALSVPPVPPSPPAHPPPPLATRGMTKSPLFGGSGGVNTPWDDGPSHAGQAPQVHDTIHMQECDISFYCTQSTLSRHYVPSRTSVPKQWDSGTLF